MPIAGTTLALLAVQLLFAIHYVGTKWLLGHIPATAWVAIRVCSAAVLLVLLTAPWWQRYPRSVRLWAQLAGLSIFGVVLNQVLFIEGLARTVPSHSALINTSIPVSTLLIALLLRRERASLRKMLAVVLSLGGVLFLLLSTGLELAGGTLVGDLLCLANATSFSIFLVLSRPIVQGLSPWVSTPIVFACGAVGVGLYGAPAVGELDWSAVPTQVWWVGAGLVLGPTVGAYFLNYWALARVESSRVALFIYLQFLLAAPLSAWLLDERLTWRLIPAAVLVFGGVALSSRPGRGAPRLGPTAPRADTASS